MNEMIYLHDDGVVSHDRRDDSAVAYVRTDLVMGPLNRLIQFCRTLTGYADRYANLRRDSGLYGTIARLKGEWQSVSSKLNRLLGAVEHPEDKRCGESDGHEGPCGRLKPCPIHGWRENGLERWVTPAGLEHLLAGNRDVRIYGHQTRGRLLVRFQVMKAPHLTHYEAQELQLATSDEFDYPDGPWTCAHCQGHNEYPRPFCVHCTETR